jgi:hypothetical protein
MKKKNTTRRLLEEGRQRITLENVHDAVIELDEINAKIKQLGETLNRNDLGNSVRVSVVMIEEIIDRLRDDLAVDHIDED